MHRFVKTRQAFLEIRSLASARAELDLHAEGLASLEEAAVSRGFKSSIDQFGDPTSKTLLKIVVLWDWVGTIQYLAMFVLPLPPSTQQLFSLFSPFHSFLIPCFIRGIPAEISQRQPNASLGSGRRQPLRARGWTRAGQGLTYWHDIEN